MCLINLFLSNEREKRSGFGWEGSGGRLGGVDGREIVIRVPDMTKESIFRKRKRIKERLTAT